MAHHLVVFADFVRNTGMTLVEAVEYIGNHYDDLDDELIDAYEGTFEELMQYVKTQM